MGIISINGLRLLSHHGVLPQERRVGNMFEITLKMDVPSADKAMESDNLNDTVNYAEVVDLIKKEMATPSSLLEHVAGRIINALRLKYPDMIVGGEIIVSKLAPPIAAELASVSYTKSF